MKLSILAATSERFDLRLAGRGSEAPRFKALAGQAKMNPPLPDHDYHVMSDAELSATIKEASQAAVAMRGVNAR